MSYDNENKQLFDSGEEALQIFSAESMRKKEREIQRQSVLCTFIAWSKLYDPSVLYVYGFFLS